MSETIEAGDSGEEGQWCILLPCSEGERWAVPQNTLGEIVTLHADSEQPPDMLTWRGESVPVLDLGGDGESPWREPMGGTGLVAVFLGLEGEKCRYWGLALRGTGLAVKRLLPAEIEEATGAVAEYATAAFDLAGDTCQVPDLPALQRRAADNLIAA